MEGKIIETKLEKLETRFEKVETRLGKVEARFEKVETKLEKLDEDVKWVKSKITSHDDVLHRLETTQDRMLVMLTNHDGDIKDIKERLGNVETKMGMFDVIVAGQDKIIALLQKNDQEVTMMHPRYKRLEGRVDRIETHLQLESVPS